MNAAKFLCLALALSAPAAFGQGSLTPLGAPGPTMKSLDQIEARTPIQSLAGDSASQFIISQPGSYYLTGNLTGVSGKNCIAIVNGLNFVSLDLNGFTLSGVSGALAGINGPSASNVTIANGLITNFPGYGINLANLNLARARLEKLTVSSCAGGGIYVGSFSIVKDCVVQGCGSAAAPGLQTLSEAIVDHCVVTGTPGGDGISIDYSSIASNCVSSENGGSGIIATGSSVRIVGDTCFANGVNGVRDLSSGSMVEVTDCSCTLNGTLANASTSAGIHLMGTSGRIDHCYANGNRGRGIAVDAVNGATTVIRNSSVSNGQPNYAVASGNRTATIVSYNASTGYTSGDPVANTQ